MKNQTAEQKYINTLLAFLLFSTFIIPSFQIIHGFPKVHLSDLILPFIGIVVFNHFNREIINKSKGFLIANLSFLFIAIISLIVNHRILYFRDDFEVLKIIKFLIVFLFVMISTYHLDIIKILRFIFIVIVLFNFFHYTNLFDFNQYVMPFYGSEIQVETFGLNSLGQPDTKRIIGTLGNPNNNAVLFLFFVIYFFPESKSTNTEKLFFLLSVFGTFACQSRTGFISLGIILLVGYFIKKYTLKTLAFFSVISIGLYLFLTQLGNTYLNTLSGNIIKQNSVNSRIETWSFMWEMIKQKPIIGYSPNKEYFETTIVYSENEYLFTTWKYGFTGLISFILILWTTFYSGFQKRFSKKGFCLAMFSLVIAITSLTNNPLSDTMIYMMFAITAGLFYGEQMNKTKVEA